ncbi:hypothetical protein AGMMS49991_11580 [Spirochaetia bacterium]|nr:hypothetical protein AGMMS49991_11580 [Spirochaetia bacterium]
MFEIRKTAFNADEFDRVQFVCKARLNDPKNPFKTIVHVEWSKTGSRLIASDGKRLHVAEVRQRINRGNYKPTITRDTISFGEPVEGIMFPNWKSVVPEVTVKKGTINLADAGMSRNTDLSAGLSVAFSTLVKKTGETVNLRYLDDLPKKEWAVSIQKEKKTVILLEQKGAATETYAVFVPLEKAA